MSDTLRIYNYNLWKWVKDNKYYAIYVQKNLLNLWSINKSWGCAVSNLGDSRVIICDTYEDACNKILAIHKRRKARGYNLVHYVSQE